MTLLQRGEAAGGATSGFDYLRIALAISIMAWHTMVTLYGIDFERPYWDSWRMLAGSGLPMFFALSGYLVTGSLVKTESIGKFLSARAIRIYPALAVEVLLSALILGPLLTTLPLSAYFASEQFWAYFHNILGIITYQLPGLFDNNPFPSVANISLWTIPTELHCYIAMTAIAAFGLLRRRSLMLAVFLLAIVWETYKTLHMGPDIQFMRPQNRILIASSLGGVLAYCYRDRIPHSAAAFVVALALQLILTRYAVTAWLAVIPTVYVVVYLGLLNPPKYTFLLRGDYSYGLYLFAFPIQQTYAMLFVHHRVWWISFPVALGAGLLYAVFSWHVIEKPLLLRRKAIVSWCATGLRALGRAGRQVVAYAFAGASVQATAAVTSEIE